MSNTVKLISPIDGSVYLTREVLTRDAAFMHCLPVRRNVVVSDEVLNSDRSLVLRQAENRLKRKMKILGDQLDVF